MSQMPDVPLHIDLLIDKLLQKTIMPEEFDILADWRAADRENDLFVDTLVQLCEPAEYDEDAKRIVNKAYRDFIQRTARFKNRRLH